MKTTPPKARDESMMAMMLSFFMIGVNAQILRLEKEKEEKILDAAAKA